MRFLLLLFLLSTPALAFENEMMLADPVQEAKAKEIFKEIRCLVCKGESLAESNAELAVNMRILIRDKVAAGQDEEEIRDYLLIRYGETILQKPPFSAQTYFLWLMPAILLIFGFITILRITFHKKHGTRRTS